SEDRLDRHVAHDDPLSRPHDGGAGATIEVADRREEFEKLSPEASLNPDLEQTRVGISQLNIPHVRLGNPDGHVQDLEERTMKFPGWDQPRAQLRKLRQPGEPVR